MIIHQSLEGSVTLSNPMHHTNTDNLLSTYLSTIQLFHRKSNNIRKSNHNPKHNTAYNKNKYLIKADSNHLKYFSTYKLSWALATSDWRRKEKEKENENDNKRKNATTCCSYVIQPKIVISYPPYFKNMHTNPLIPVPILHSLGY